MPKKKTKEQVLKDFKKVHGDTYDYSLVNYVNTQTKVSIICKEHGIFEQTPNKHIMGRRCPKCFGHIKLTTEQFVEKANITHNNKYDYRLSIYKGNKNKLKIICHIHGVFEQTPIAHTKGQGCYYCGIEKVNNIKRFTIYEFIEKAKKVHGDKYDYRLVEYKGMDDIIFIICPNHGLFKQKVKKHIIRQGCPKCSGKNKTTEDIIKEFKVIHGSKYDYSLVEYMDAKTKVKIICKEHGVFSQRPTNHLNGNKCPKCSSLKANKSNLFYNDKFIDRAKEKHGDKYDYSLVKYIKTKSKISIICKSHGVFEQMPWNHLIGQGCPKCGNINISKHQKIYNTGWSISRWNESAKKSKNFDSFKVYIIRCYNDKENFYKIGRTFTTIQNRFISKNSMPYNYEIIAEFVFDTPKEAFDKEIELKKKNIEFVHIPKIKFDGMHECFNEIKIRD